MYSETEEVAKILMEMLDDLATRLSVIDEVDEQAKKLVDDAYAKMLEWEKKLVVLANGEAPRSPIASTALCPPLHAVHGSLRRRWGAGKCSAFVGTHGVGKGEPERW